MNGKSIFSSLNRIVYQNKWRLLRISPPYSFHSLSPAPCTRTRLSRLNTKTNFTAGICLRMGYWCECECQTRIEGEELIIINACDRRRSNNNGHKTTISKWRALKIKTTNGSERIKSSHTDNTYQIARLSTAQLRSVNNNNNSECRKDKNRRAEKKKENRWINAFPFRVFAIVCGLLSIYGANTHRALKYSGLWCSQTGCAWAQHLVRLLECGRNKKGKSQKNERNRNYYCVCVCGRGNWCSVFLRTLLAFRFLLSPPLHFFFFVFLYFPLEVADTK